jgi:hypothetical protein
MGAYAQAVVELLKILGAGVSWWINLTDEQRKAVKSAFEDLKNADDTKKPGAVRHAVNRLNATL